MNKLLFNIGAIVAVAGLVGASGQLAFAAEPVRYKQIFTMPLTGSQQVPVVQTQATGSAMFKVSEDEKQVDYSLSATNITNIVAGHIHCGAAGSNGPVIADLVESPLVSASGEFASGSLTDASIKAVGATCSPGITNAAQLIQAMREGAVYVNIHTTEFPNGLIRGQIGTTVAAPNPTPMPLPSPMPASNKLLATANPDGVANDAIVSLSANLEAAITKFKNFSGVTSIQSVARADDGTAFVTYDGATGSGGVLKIANVETSATYQIIADASSGLIAPKGIELVPARNAYIVSDNGAKAITVFASGSGTPTFTIKNLGDVARNVWDTSYDNASDTLYVAGTDGVVVVYDDFFLDKGVYGPTKLLIPSTDSGTKVSVNLHGIVYVPARDALILSDVGSATVASDGQIFTLNNVLANSGKVAVTARIAGTNTKLGNPVDLSYDGQQLYVAEKANDLVLQYNDIFSRSGDTNVAATFSQKVTKPESISL